MEEDEWYRNATGSQDFDDFLNFLGERITLQVRKLPK
jgi:hypothetical protein